MQQNTVTTSPVIKSFKTNFSARVHRKILSGSQDYQKVFHFTTFPYFVLSFSF